MTEFKLAEKLGEGNFRECFAVEGEPGLCVKRLKPRLGFWRRLNLQVLRPGMNKEEYDIYHRLPDEMKPYFNPVIEVGDDYLVTGRPLDYDGSHSKPVVAYGKIAHRGFWQEIDKILLLFEKYNLWFYDTMKGRNLFVRKLSEDEWVPVIVDYKRLGWRSYPIQINLMFDSEKKRKCYRYLERFKKRYKAY
ncbi:MAG: hypothetical protein RG741_00220 [Bacteroidales bacterium]|nr:hypothetical protein [Bacteroidales bacterium]